MSDFVEVESEKILREKNTHSCPSGQYNTIQYNTAQGVACYEFLLIMCTLLTALCTILPSLSNCS